MEYAVIFVFGLIIGSFLNAVLYRLSVKQSAFRGRSYCPRCRHELAVLDLIPLVSFLLLRGRCRYCGKRISWQYPAVELATAISFVLLFVRLSQAGALDARGTLEFVAYALFTCFLIVIFVYDLLHYLILDEVILPGAVLAFIFNLTLGVSWTHMVAAAAVGASFFALQFVLSNGRWVGGGDIRLGALMGIMLAWPQLAVALFIAYIVGGVIGVGLIAAGAKTMQSRVPFGTFLSAATFLVLLYGRDILAWYSRFYL